MKVFIDAHVFDDYSQGSKTYLAGLYSSAVKMKPDWEFLFSAHNTKNVFHELGKEKNVQAINLTSQNKFSRLALEIPGIIKRERPDFAHFQYISPLVKSCPEVITIHDLLFLDFPEYFPLDYRLVKNFLFKRSAERADLVLTVSEYSKEAIIRHYKIPERKIAITPNGVLDAFFDEHEELLDIKAKYGVDQFILYVSRIEPRKNQLGLLKAYCELELWKTGVQLVLIGGVGIVSKDYTSYFKSLENHIKKNVFFFQNLSVSELKAFYKQSKLFVYPSFAEGFGIPPLEAAACGSNVICSSTTAMGEFDFLGDRLFDPNNFNELKEKVAYYLSHPQYSGIDSVKKIVQNKYNWGVSADVLIDQLNTLSF